MHGKGGGKEGERRTRENKLASFDRMAKRDFYLYRTIILIKIIAFYNNYLSSWA